MAACTAIAAAVAWVVDSLPPKLPLSHKQCSRPRFFSQGRQGSGVVHRFLCMHNRVSGRSSSARRNSIRAETSDTEKAFQTTVELDKFIDELRYADQQELPVLVAKNVLAFDTPFWLRLAARADICGSNDDKKDYEMLAASIMTIVECVIQKTQEEIESSTGVLESILQPITQKDEEIIWPPRDPSILVEMKKEVERKEQQGFLDESFLSAVTAQIRQAREGGDKPGLVAILQKVLQLYAAQMLSKRSYALKDGQVVQAEEFLETIISADEENWEGLIRSGLVYGGGQIEPEELFKVVKKRVERVDMRTESGSYQQRVVLEYLKEIEERAQAVIEAFQTSRT
ncbi:hypothetical protein GOP47_0002058 [Adiantum capillus-veneris]|uniref:Uncharacterized protein n=1 Tax=Adiantum capillus-veneris TaxID=13818 RepID=A0A9D4ZR97_ADICA|nr:hypothetical protein GOP47_0002058 [Adiantum capillus-veneris]